MVAFLSIAAAVVVCSTILDATADGQTAPATPAWTWIDAAGQTRTQAEFDAIVAQHALWLTTAGARGVRANLANAKLLSLIHI